MNGKSKLLLSIFLITAFILVLIYLLYKSSLLKNPSTSLSGPSVHNKTSIIKYKQTYVPEISKSGSCVMGSNAANNAWRCYYEPNFIADPCFATNDKKVVCGVNPEVEGSGFQINLTEPLLDLQESNLNDYPWLIKLTNGSKCSPLTGSAGSIGKISYHYVCDNKAFLLDEINQNNDVWQVKLAYPNEDMSAIDKTEVVSVVTAWE